jgi:hypothetical protein
MKMLTLVFVYYSLAKCNQYKSSIKTYIHRKTNQYQYGKWSSVMMVCMENQNPHLSSKTSKWHSITILLTLIRFSNTFTSRNKAEALTETVGRTIGWWSLLLIPKIKKGLSLSLLVSSY